MTEQINTLMMVDNTPVLRKLTELHVSMSHIKEDLKLVHITQDKLQEENSKMTDVLNFVVNNDPWADKRSSTTQQDYFSRKLDSVNISFNTSMGEGKTETREKKGALVYFKTSTSRCRKQ